MRLWPLSIISQLPRQQLLGQHRECCALRGKGWGRKHSTVDYVFKHPFKWLYLYHLVVLNEMDDRGYKVASGWWLSNYRGKTLGMDDTGFTECATAFDYPLDFRIYPEHDAAYLNECLENLRRKGVVLRNAG